MVRMLLAALLAALPLTTLAGNWSGEFDAGYISTTGNSRTSSISAKAVADYKVNAWKNSFVGTALNSSDHDVTTAEHYTAADQLSWDFTLHDYLFGNAEYEKDLFGGVRDRTSETAGYGRHILLGPVHVLDAEIGAGARQTKKQITGERNNEVIGRAQLKYNYKIADTSALAQNLKVESGKSNTYMESITELKLAIVGNLAAALTYTVKHNSTVPAGTARTDTFTGINLVYTFGK
jgi:putative salt-induced outer membrane protein